MKNRLSKSLAFSAILMMLLSTMAIFPVHAQAFEVYLVPSDPVFDTSGTSPCYKFNVTAWIKDLTTPVWATQIYLEITPDENWLNITNAWLPAVSDPQNIFFGKTAVRPSPAFYDFDVDTYIEAVKAGDSLSSPATPVSGAGPFKIAIIEFHITRAPAKYEALFTNLNIDNVDTYFLAEDLSTVTPIIKTDGSVTYNWSPPATDPHMAVVPAYVLIDQYT
ncbi:hypothetical protein KAU55_04890, partial [Candidatus Bathyarchaeota archaeon]|nr:hypothetical protein [Candidatus Bathyarchaeota archaeon]